MQPPSGGCVLKRCNAITYRQSDRAAAFGRLCVETNQTAGRNSPNEPAAAFGRLCVETLDNIGKIVYEKCSRLRAAVC